MQALNDIDPDVLEQDTAQYLNYLYNFGSGGAIQRNTPNEVAQAEFDHLIQCYMLASGSNPYPYWQANALQAISEHIPGCTAARLLWSRTICRLFSISMWSRCRANSWQVTLPSVRSISS